MLDESMLAAWECLSDRIISSIILCPFRGAEVPLLKLWSLAYSM